MSGDNPFGSDDLSASTSGADSFHGAAGARLMETSFGGDNPFAAAQDDEEVRPSARARPRERRARAAHRNASHFRRGQCCSWNGWWSKICPLAIAIAASHALLPAAM